MKVGELDKNPLEVIKLPVQGGKKVASANGALFKSQLDKAEDNSYGQHLEELVNAILKQGEKLSKKIDVKEFRAYKKLISEFLDSALGKSMKFSKRSLLDRKGRHKVYSLIRNINEEVDKLAQDLMKGE